MQNQAKASGVKLPEVYGVDKGVDPNVKPERQIRKSPNTTTQLNKPRSGEGRPGLRRKMKAPAQVQNASAIQKCKSNTTTNFIKTKRPTCTFD